LVGTPAEVPRKSKFISCSCARLCTRFEGKDADFKSAK